MSKISLSELDGNKKILISLDEYLNLRGVNYRLKKNRIECIRILNDIKDGVLNPEQKINKIIDILNKDELL